MPSDSFNSNWSTAVTAIVLAVVIASCSVLKKQAEEKTAQEALKAGYEQQTVDTGLSGSKQLIWVKKSQ